MKRADIQRVVDALPEPAVLVSPEGATTYFNAAAAEKAGLSRVGEKLAWRLSALDRSPLPEDPIAMALTGRLVEQRVLLNGSHGTLLETQLRAIPLRAADSTLVGVLVTFTDLSNKAESDLQEYQRYFDLSDDFLAVSTRDGRILRVNEGATRLLGWPKENYLGNAGTLSMHPDDLRRALQVIASGVAQHDFITRLRHASGEWRLMSWTLRPEQSPTFGEVVYLRGVDVTEKLRREEELVASREQLAEAQDIAKIGTVTVDLRTKKLVVSARARQLFELPDDDSAGEVLKKRLVIDDRQREVIERIKKGQSATLQLRADLPRGRRDFKFWARPNRNLEGEVLRVVAVVQDVTDEVKLAAQLRLAERLASVGTLAAGVAHEINNPLAFIVANLNSVRGELSRVNEMPGLDVGDLKSALAEASEGAERVRTIVAGLRAFTRVDETSVTLCDVRRVLDAVLNLSRNEIRHRAKVVTNYSPVSVVLANEARLAQVFLNLVLNAAQSIADGHVDANTITISTGNEGPDVVVTVQDTGSGIPAHLLSRIFDPFFTTKGIGSGTGLGLFIAQGILRELGGELRVASTSPQGSTFKVTLPAAPSDGPALTPPSPAMASGDGLRVLVVDDEPLILRSLQRMLGRTHRITLAQSGKLALDHLKNEPFDVVLCDMMMPEFSGIALWHEVDAPMRERMVFMTGGTFTEDARSFLAKHQPLLLAKPFTIESVTAILLRAAKRTKP